MWCIIFSDSSLFCWITTSSKWFISIEQIQFTDLLCKIRCRPQACAVWTVHQWIHITSSLLHVSTWSYRLRGGGRSVVQCTVSYVTTDVHSLSWIPQRRTGWKVTESCSPLRAWPPLLASFSPVSLRSASNQPQKRFSWFQLLSPWRISTSL